MKIKYILIVLICIALFVLYRESINKEEMYRGNNNFSYDNTNTKTPDLKNWSLER